MDLSKDADDMGIVLYRDFVLLLLCYIVRSCIIVVLRVCGCACAVNAEHD